MTEVADDERGFVLTEALAALALAAIIGAGLIAALQSTSQRSDEARVRALALNLADAQLATALADPSLGADEGITGDLTWRRIIAPYPAMASAERVAIEVDWSTLRKSGTTRLEGVRLADAE